MTKVAINVIICTRSAMTIIKILKVCYLSKYTYLNKKQFLKKSIVLFKTIFKTLSIFQFFGHWPYDLQSFKILIIETYYATNQQKIEFYLKYLLFRLNNT